MKKSTKILVGIAVVWYLTRPKKSDDTVTVPGSQPPGTPKPLTAPRSTVRDPGTGQERPVTKVPSDAPIPGADLEPESAAEGGGTPSAGPPSSI